MQKTVLIDKKKIKTQQLSPLTEVPKSQHCHLEAWDRQLSTFNDINLSTIEALKPKSCSDVIEIL